MPKKKNMECSEPRGRNDVEDDGDVPQQSDREQSESEDLKVENKHQENHMSEDSTAPEERNDNNDEPRRNDVRAKQQRELKKVVDEGHKIIISAGCVVTISEEMRRNDSFMEVVRQFYQDAKPHQTRSKTGQISSVKGKSRVG